jgi:hypothetical protein
MEAHDRGDLSQCQLVVIVEAKNGALHFGHFVDGRGQQLFEFGALEKNRRPVILAVGDELQQIASFFLTANILQAAYVHDTHLD